MNYTIRIERSAQKSLARIPQPYQDRIIDAIRNLATIPRPHGTRKLGGKDAWRIRVGDYRILYEIDDGQLDILIVTLGHRKEIYRKR